MSTNLGRRRWVAGSCLLALAPAAFTGCAAPPARPAGGGAPQDDRPAGPLRADPADTAWLNRLTWGVDSASIGALGRLGRRDYLQAQLHPPAGARLPAAVQARVESFGAQRKPMTTWVVEMDQLRRDSDAAAGEGDEAKKAARQAYQQAMNGLARDAAATSLLHALYTPDQLQSQLTWFWFNHFNVHQAKSNLRAMVGDYEAGLRQRALGRFEDLLLASATHAAMIRYLDNDQNAAGRSNENYAREVMELHTLGVDGGYTQKDVQELARVLTGLGTNLADKPPQIKPALQPQYRRTGLTEFNPQRHDQGEKTVLGVPVAGQGWDGIIGTLQRLARHPATARHVCRKLAVYLAADDPPPALVDRMAHAWSRSAGDIAVTLQALFEAPEFTPTLGRKFKDPVHWVVSAVRLAYDGRTIANAAPMLGWINRLGEPLYGRQTPDGWPLDAAAWSGSGQMGARFEIARTLGSSAAGLFRGDEAGAVDAPAFPQLSNAVYHGALAATLGPRTQAALAAAGSAPEWNALLLSSPEFMYR